MKHWRKPIPTLFKTFFFFILFYVYDTVIISESAKGLNMLLMSFIHIVSSGNYMST
jgi:hypothetical protein